MKNSYLAIQSKGIRCNQVQNRAFHTADLQDKKGSLVKQTFGLAKEQKE